MNELFDISILAESENGIIEIVFFVVVAALGIIGSVVSSLKKKRDEQQEQQRLAELRDEARAENDDDDGWSTVEQPYPVAPPPVQVEKYQQEVTDIGDFVKSARRRLVPEQEAHKPEPVPVPVPIPVHLKSATVGQPPIRSSHPPKIVRSRTRGKSTRPTTPRNGGEVHRTVTDAAMLGPVYLQPPATAIHLDAAAARKAIIFHEIFSPPKALREQYELWD